MPPKARKKLGYNWRARQSQKKTSEGDLLRRKRDKGIENSRVGEDTNALVLHQKPKKSLKAIEEAGTKRKRLSCMQRKRLLKILEAKEKKAKRSEILTQLSSLSLPPTQLTHLLPSTSLSSARPPAGLLGSMCHSGGGGEEKEGGVGGWRVRRKRRRRRQLRAEKEVWSLHNVSSAGNGEQEEDEENGEGEEGGMEVEEEEEELRGQVEEAECKEQEEEEREEEERELLKVQEVGRGETAVVAVESVVEKCVAVFVQLERPADVQESRGELPVVGEEGRIMEVIRESPATVLCGETGSGKTTQLPQFLYEHGYTLPNGPCGGEGMIAVTEPRRVAAVGMAHRVAYEMGLSHRQVSYQIRYEGNVTDETVVKFMTDGVLLKEIEQDLLLQRYNVVVVDEAHERSVFTDILLGLLSRILPLREKNGRPLKLVVMSATMRVEDFSNNPLLFPSPPPTLSVESRQFPVTVHFNRRTPTSYVREAYRKICKIHRHLPMGHVLVFVTGQREVLRLCRLLRDTFTSAQSASGERGGEDGGRRRRRKKRKGVVDLDKYPLLPELASAEEEEEEVGEREEEEEGEKDWEAEVSAYNQQLPMLVLPLYSLLSSERQAEVFQPVPEGVRLCVVATNVAETSITIPHIRYVVDTGKVKRRYYDKVTGISTFRVEWVSQASANQRAGRAGRTQPGHCYRLYSSAVFQNQFPKFSEPEICRRPVEDLVLQMKALGIERVTNFPFPTPPSSEALQAAEAVLEGLGALSSAGTLTDLGHIISQFPVSPRYGKMLALGHQHGCLPYIISLVAALSVKELVVQTSQSWSEVSHCPFSVTDLDILFQAEEGGRGRGKEGRIRVLASLRKLSAVKAEFRQLGNLGLLLMVVGAWSHSGRDRDFCSRTGVQLRAMREVARLRQQLTNSVNMICPDVNLAIDPKLAPPTEDQARHLRQIVLAGLGDHVARKIATEKMAAEDKRKLRFSYQCVSCEGPVYLDPHSSLTSCAPDYLVYQELVDSGNRIYMRGVAAVEEAWLPKLVPQFCTFSDPLELPSPTFDPNTGTVQCHVTCKYGPHQWPLGSHEVAHPPGLQLYRLFALFLLQGKVCPALAEFSSSLLLPPVTMVKSWAKLHPQTTVLLKALVEREVSSRHSLTLQWQTQPKYLLKAFSLWLPQSKHAHLAAVWPPK